MVIVNPNAGVKKGTKDWPQIERLLHSEGIAFDSRLTACRGDAAGLAAGAVAAGYRNICTVGGDGTLNEVLNGVMQQQQTDPAEITLGMIPVGTGNDWCRMYGIPFDYRGAIRILKEGKTCLQDAGRVTHYHGERKEERWFMNVAGMGYDALVAKKTNLLKEKGFGGPLTYMYFVFASLFQYRFIEAVIETDGRTVFKGEIFSMNVGICKYSGGGMIQVPGAVPDDGLFDVTVIEKAPKWVVIRHVGKLYDGSLVNLPMVKTFRGEQVRIRSTGKLYLETDGESLGHTPFGFEMRARCLRVVTAK